MTAPLNDLLYSIFPIESERDITCAMAHHLAGTPSVGLVFRGGLNYNAYGVDNWQLDFNNEDIGC